MERGSANNQAENKIPDADSQGTDAGRRKRQPRTFPALSFKEALFLGEAIQKHGAGRAIRRLTLFEALNRSPDSSTSRKLITASNQYGITTGSYSAEFLELTSDGQTATNPDLTPKIQVRAQILLGISELQPFSFIYDRYKGNRLPTVQALRDTAIEADVSSELAAECVETFLANARELGLVRTIAGSEHLVTADAALEALGAESKSDDVPALPPQSQSSPASESEVVEPFVPLVVSAGNKSEGLSDICFIISPIGQTDSMERKHADLVLSALIEPALLELGLRAVRADQISKPGLITGQVIDHVARAALVIADLSFSNPNVYYELALRHATRKPVVQIIRSVDKLPFDVGQFRTVVIDMTDIYTLVPLIELHRQEITRQARSAIDESQNAESPLSQFYPSFWDQIIKIK